MLETLAHLFLPRQTNNRRPRIIHPEGFLLLATFSLAFHLAVRLLPTSLDLGAVLGYASSITQSQVVELTNQRRLASGLPPLTANDQLSRAAEQKAQDMFANQYWAHFSPSGATPWQFIKDQGYSYSAAGENLAKDFGDTPTMVQAWMNSKTHRDNIMNDKYAEIGVAVVNGMLNDVETTLVVQMFGAPAVAGATASVPQTPAPTIQATPAPVPIAQLQTQPTVIQVETESELETPAPIEDSTIILEEQPRPTPVSIAPSAVQGLSDSVREFFTLMNPLRISKALFFVILVLLMLVLVYDIAHSDHKQFTRVVGKNVAHLILFTFILLIVLISKQGALL